MDVVQVVPGAGIGRPSIEAELVADIFKGDALAFGDLRLALGYGGIDGGVMAFWRARIRGRGRDPGFGVGAEIHAWKVAVGGRQVQCGRGCARTRPAAAVPLFARGGRWRRVRGSPRTVDGSDVWGMWVGAYGLGMRGVTAWDGACGARTLPTILNITNTWKKLPEFSARLLLSTHCISDSCRREMV